MRHPLSFPDISIFHQKVAIFVILGKKLKLHFYIKFVTTAAFFEFMKVILINAIVILMMSAILANQGFILKKSFWSHNLCPSWWHHRQYFITWRTLFCIYVMLLDLIPFVQFKKLEKYPWRGVTFSKVADFSMQLY